MHLAYAQRRSNKLRIKTALKVILSSSAPPSNILVVSFPLLTLGMHLASQKATVYLLLFVLIMARFVVQLN